MKYPVEVRTYKLTVYFAATDGSVKAQLSPDLAPCPFPPVPPLRRRDYGGNTAFSGPISTVLCHENNPLVRDALERPGLGRVLVVDGGASMRCALLGDMLAGAGLSNGWQVS